MKNNNQNDTRHINIQFQPSRCPGIESADIIASLKVFSDNSDLVDTLKTSEDVDDDYLNIFLATSDLINLWSGLREFVFSSGEFSASILAALIVICEGDDGWNDYLLLYHYDSSMSVDELH